MIARKAPVFLVLVALLCANFDLLAACKAYCVATGEMSASAPVAQDAARNDASTNSLINPEQRRSDETGSAQMDENCAMHCASEHAAQAMNGLACPLLASAMILRDAVRLTSPATAAAQVVAVGTSAAALSNDSVSAVNAIASAPLLQRTPAASVPLRV